MKISKIIHITELILFFIFIPFVLAILRYGIVIDRGDAEAPEDAVTADKALLLLGAAWLILFAMGALGV